MDHDSRLLLMNPRDNCLILREPLPAGAAVHVDGRSVVLAAALTAGHKLARRDIGAGEKILRYGAVIGTATQDIGAGQHVHTHNLRSDYLPTYTLQRGGEFVAPRPTPLTPTAPLAPPAP